MVLRRGFQKEQLERCDVRWIEGSFGMAIMVMSFCRALATNPSDLQSTSRSVPFLLLWADNDARPSLPLPAPLSPRYTFRRHGCRRTLEEYSALNVLQLDAARTRISFC